MMPFTKMSRFFKAKLLTLIVPESADVSILSAEKFRGKSTKKLP
jgi:hypothetical protein